MGSIDFLELVLLEGFYRIGQQRTSAGLIHIIYGKRNHQTWSDIHYFSLTSLYCFLEKEESNLLQQVLSGLVQRELLQPDASGTYKLTETGESLYLGNQHRLVEKGIRDGRIMRKMRTFWAQLHLLIQSNSFLLHKEREFYPVVLDFEIQKEVKYWLRKFGLEKGSRGLFLEWKTVLEQLTPSEQRLALYRLTGYHRTSYTLQQLARLEEKEYWQIKWEWECFLTRLYEIIGRRSWTYLPHLETDSIKLLSISSRETWKSYQAGLSLEEIAQRRKLKLATVLDHMAEIALVVPEFPLHDFVSPVEYKAIVEVIEAEGTLRLRFIKERLPQISFFQIRLVLSYLKRERERRVEHEA